MKSLHYWVRRALQVLALLLALPAQLRADIIVTPPPAGFQVRGLATLPDYTLYVSSGQENRFAKTEDLVKEVLAEGKTYLISESNLQQDVCVRILALQRSTGKLTKLRTLCSGSNNVGQRFWLTFSGVKNGKIVLKKERMASAKSEANGFGRFGSGAGPSGLELLLLATTAGSLLLLHRYRRRIIPIQTGW